jgi:uncharacterized protein
MASGFFALFDDIAVLMDDVATMSKLATKKTAGILADDLAVNADKASGFVSARELPVLWRITKGSFLNKLIILPLAFLLSAFLPGAIVPILLAGGVYLAFEGTEKIYEFLFHKKKVVKKEVHGNLSSEEILILENKKIKSAILVDFILSVEIVMIALGSVVSEPLQVQVITVTFVAILATVGVYGLVALLVRMDDFGYSLIARANDEGSIAHKIGNALVRTLPFLIRALSVIGTFAMILVAGGIFVHGIAYIHTLVHSLPAVVGEFLVGLLVGIIAVILFKLFRAIFFRRNQENTQET